jgi:acetyl esterase/lipase
MPLGYLIPVAVLAFGTAVAVIGPRPAHTTPSYWGWWVTFLINEQPFAALAWLAASSAPAVAQGDLDLVGAVLAAATAVGLIVLIRRALATGPALRRALPDLDLPAGSRPWARILLAPFAVRRHDVTRVKDIAFGDQQLDLYHRRDRPTGAPVLVFWHGGGFRSGDKNREGRALLNHLAARGWVCVSANYRLAPAARFPDSLVDAKRAIAWVRSHAAEYGADPRTLVVSGSSAGANLASMVALTPDDAALQPGFEAADTSVSAVVAFYGYYGRVDGPGSSPVDRVRDAPPFLVLHGDKDSSTLVEDTRDFVARLRAVSTQPVRYAELPGAQHTFDLWYSLRYSQVIDAVTAFVERVHARPHRG